MSGRHLKTCARLGELAPGSLRYAVFVPNHGDLVVVGGRERGFGGEGVEEGCGPVCVVHLLAEVGAKVDAGVAKASAEFMAALSVELEVACVACAVFVVRSVVDQDSEVINGVGVAYLDAEVLEIISICLDGGFIHGETVEGGCFHATCDREACVRLGDAHPA